MKANWPAAFAEPPMPRVVGAHNTVQESAAETAIQPLMVKAVLAAWCIECRISGLWLSVDIV